MPTDHDTYLHKVASAPVKEDLPHDDTQPFDTVTATDAVPPPKNVLAGELVTAEEDEFPDEFAPSEHDAPTEPEAEADTVPEPEAASISEPDKEPTLLADGAATREKWMRLQASFVDDPRAAVIEGAALVADVLAQLEAAVRGRKQPSGDTEALRLQMRQYRLLVDRLTGL